MLLFAEQRFSIDSFRSMTHFEQQNLIKASRDFGGVFCDCQRQPLPLVVAHLSTGYRLSPWPNMAGFHDAKCNFFKPFSVALAMHNALQRASIFFREPNNVASPISLWRWLATLRTVEPLAWWVPKAVQNVDDLERYKERSEFGRVIIVAVIERVVLGKYSIGLHCANLRKVLWLPAPFNSATITSNTAMVAELTITRENNFTLRNALFECIRL